MAEYIEQTVQQTAANPTNGAKIKLCIGCTTENTDPIKEAITDLDGDVIDTFKTPATNGVIAVAPEENLQQLIGHSHIKTIESTTLSLAI